MLWKLNETKNFRKSFHDVLERGIGIKIKRHYILSKLSIKEPENIP